MTRQSSSTWRSFVSRLSLQADSPAPPRPYADPFALLALDPDCDLSDDDVRAAWRRIATATHPDRADGGDPDRFALAAAAYTALRTHFDRNEARAARAEPAPRARARRTPRAAAPHAPSRFNAVGLGPAAHLLTRVRQGRPIRLTLRVLAAVATGILGFLAASPSPAAGALATGALTWLALTLRGDLTPPS
jgi:hypothetical protein